MHDPEGDDDDDEMPADGPLDETEKPGVSYAKLAAMAIEASPNHEATVADIYTWVKAKYPFFRQGKPWWKVRPLLAFASRLPASAVPPSPQLCSHTQARSQGWLGGCFAGLVRCRTAFATTSA
jgi:hypothetical protein